MATVSIRDMRNAIAQVYNKPKWKNDVKNMPDNQVVAIYHRFLKSGKFDKKEKNIPTKKQQFNKRVSWRELETMEQEGCFYEQLSFDL